jgi:glycosyltransferase involved in cell wall biosynthesis
MEVGQLSTSGSRVAPDRRVRVLVLMNRADDETGGSLRAAVNAAAAMSVAGACITFSAPVFKHRSTETISSLPDDVDVRLFPTAGPAARFGASFRQLRWLLANVHSFDAVHIHTIFHVSAVYAAMVSAVRKRPYYYWPHGSLLPYDLRKHSSMKRVLRPLLRRLLRHSAGIVCVTPREAEETVDFGAGPPRVTVPLPVPAPAPAITPQAEWRQRYGIPESAFLLLFLGRLDYKKRLDRLIEAVELLPSNFHLAIVGAAAGPEAASIRQLIASKSLESRVHVIGWLEGEQRSGAFAASDCFVLSSDNENFGIAVVEALHMGVPVVISDQVYIHEELHRLGCALVSERTPQAVAAAASTLAGDPRLREDLIERGRRVAAEKYGLAAVGERLVAEVTG